MKARWKTLKVAALALSLSLGSVAVMADDMAAPPAPAPAVSAPASAAAAPAPAAPDAAAAVAAAPAAPSAPFLVGFDKIDSGATAWMLTSTALVLFMTIPGLALFYGGMVRKKNVLATLMQSLPSAPW